MLRRLLFVQYVGLPAVPRRIRRVRNGRSCGCCLRNSLLLLRQFSGGSRRPEHRGEHARASAAEEAPPLDRLVNYGPIRSHVVRLAGGAKLPAVNSKPEIYQRSVRECRGSAAPGA